MALVDDLIQKGVLKTPRLIEAFRDVDRKDFLPPDEKSFAYLDEPLSIGEGQTISQPWTVAFMLGLLDPNPNENILEIGYGSGWQTALLTHFGANVYAIERVESLCEFGKQNVEKFPLLTKEGIGEVKFYCQDGTKGLPEIAKEIGGFDKVVVAAAITEVPTNVGTTSNLLPKAWKKQLKIGGKIVAPICCSIFVFIKKSETEFDAEEHPGFAFVPLIKDK